MKKQRKFVSFKDSKKVQELLNQIYGCNDDSKENRQQQEPNREDIKRVGLLCSHPEHDGFKKY